MLSRRAILGNPDVLHTTPWNQIVSNDFWGTPLVDSGSHGSYRPLCVLTFKLNHLFGGFKPAGYHLVNVLLHCLATGLVVKVGRLLLPTATAVAVAGLLFASHPVHTEAVAGIVGRADLAACNLYLLSFLAYSQHIKWRAHKDLRCWGTLLLTIVLAAAAVLCKETAISALLFCATYDVIQAFNGFHDKVRLRVFSIQTDVRFIYCRLLQNRIKSLSIIGLSMATIVQLRLSLPGPVTDFSTADNPVAKATSTLTRFLTFLYLPAFNFKLLVYPSQLSFDWGMDAIPRLNTIFDSRNLISLAFYAALAASIAVNVRHIHRRWVKLSGKSASDRQRKPRMLRKRKVVQLAHLSGRPSGNGAPNDASNINYINSITNNNNCALIDNKNIIGGATAAAVNNNYSNKITDCICAVCSDGLNLRHSSSCRAINNNNAPSTHCGCPKRRQSTSPSPTSSRQTQQGGVNRQHRPLITITLTGCDFAAVIAAVLRRISIKNLNAINLTGRNSVNQGTQSDGNGTPTNTAATAAILSIALLAFTFLPASNLLFYVGFVVAERVLYLPSVGYCLLIGLGVGMVIGSSQGALADRRKRHAAIFCVSVVLMSYSAKTIGRNVDWRDEESLYRSAIQVNPPKGN